MPPLEREPAIRPDAAGRSPRDERGSTLVLVLALVIFVSIAAVAVLDQETTASNAQRAYENLRVGDQAADSTVNALIHTMRYSQAQGAAAPEVVPSGTLCSNTTGWSQVNGQQVYCQADPSSLTLQRDASDLPPNAILTLGGLDGRGNRQADTSATPASYNAPFCDDYHDFQAGGSSDRCETGLFVGRGVSDTSTNGGGLYVAETGRVDRTPPLVASNSSIVINPANSLRSLTVDGTVWARRGCGSGAGTTLDASQIFAGHDPKTGASDAARRLCAGGSDPTKWQNPTSGGLVSDPDYAHEPIDLSSVPRVDNWTNHPGPTLPLDPNTICRNGNAGFAVMPAAKIGTRTINGTSYDVFGAWYDSASALNNLFGSALCADTFFWFRPGVYYFDFLDTNTTNWYTQSDNNKGVSTAWNNAAGCWPLPTNTLCTVDEVVGGLPPDSPSPLKWNTCDTYLASGTVVDCPQPTKVMYPEKSSGATSSDWTTHPENTSRIDEQFGSTAVGAGNVQSTLTSDQLQTPIPQLANTTIGAVTELKFEIAYKLYNTKGLTGAAAFKDQSLDKQNLGPGADVKLIIGGLTGGSCTIHLYPGDHSATTRGTPDHATGPGEVFNLLNGCNPSSPDRTFTKDGV
ncbi:MAG TPA: hypothetical protein VN636_01870, partial [Acidimicrobiia bacterium]|nr:hypothetical protein [Acidimicrobiia bacterium]